ncbi:putative HC-toxin synthetase [Podospora australis]|uniref:Brevianamide F synthase n=1 Tax=Podospora australis TaxID=1536484 RepID=A0AAN7AE17_9PEZI|nr:putative HC-toxin synthetase [Podospora australis]
MHLAQHAPGFMGLGGGLKRDAMHLDSTNISLEAVTRTIPTPESALDALILAWAALLQRERGDDNHVQQFTWGHRSVEGAEIQLRFSLSTLGLEITKSRAEPISQFLEAVRTATENISRPGLLYLFFNDEVESTFPSQKDTELGSSQWKFQIGVTKQGDQLTLQGVWPSKNEALTARQAGNKLDTFIGLLDIITQRPKTPVSNLLAPLPHDLDQIWAWNAELPPLIDRTMQDIISEQAAAHPDKIALSSWDGQWTYAELERMSTRLAHHLTAQGVVVGTNVPLCFEKCRWTIVALLAIMKAGGAFALTDPTSQPEGRLRAMVEQTGGKIVMASKTQTELAAKLLPEGGQVVAVSEELFESFEKVQEELPPLPTIPTVSSPLYIQFTSGSTGKPKGVVVSHANFTSGAIPRAEAVGYKFATKCFEFASYAFDVSIDCMLCTLAVGGTICIPSDADRMNDLGGAIRASGANMAHMTPSVARVLDPAVIAELDVLGLGGEAVSAADAAAWSKGRTSVIIAYGPSECTVGCTVNNTFAQSKDDRKQFTTGNIGKGVGAVGWIVDPDDHDRLVPVGSVGELLIEGPVVGLGYLGESEKTAEVFIEDPKWLVEGHEIAPGRKGRLYKTGDLVYYDADGSGDFVFVGRKDAQVKLRGQRVELVEIEHHLQHHLPSGVKIAAEVIKPSGAEPTLVAFLAEASKSAATSPIEPSTNAFEDEITFSDELASALVGIEEALGADLPRYMVPAAFIPLREMPVLPSAKIDRKKLRALGAAMTREQITGSARKNKSSEGGAPSTEMEVALAAVWKSLLGEQTEVSVDDSFFALGGDSLRAMRLVPCARAEGILVTVADVFRYPVLRDMAVVAKKVSSSDDASNEIAPFSLLNNWSSAEARKEVSRLCEVNEEDVEDVYPCTPLQEALMALSAKVKEAYVAQRVLKMDTEESAKKLQNAFEAIAADSAIMRTRIVQVSDHGLLQVLVKEPVVWRSAASLAEYLEMDRDEEMGLGKHLVRFAMIREGGAYHFVLTMHHALYDGWSMPLVVDRVNQAYQGVTPRKPAAEFKHFINYLNHRLDRAGCDAYWRDQLDGANGVQFPRLPFEGYQTQADSLLEVDIKLDGRKLPTLPGATITLASVVRAAWALVASQYTSGNSDIVFGETLTGRNAPIVGVEEIEGPMITTVPVRVTIDREATVEQYLQGIAEQIVSQIPYEHAGLQHIRKLSDDALQACELRTGFVLHPAAGEVEADEKTPANGLVPAGDNEAAQEALKFNTYALMLVCSLSSDGFFVMASFDSKTVGMETMSRVLEQLRSVVHQLCEGDAKQVKVGDLQCLTDADRTELKSVSNGVKMEGLDLKELGFGEDEIEGAWIADAADHSRPSPRGAVGELLVETRKQLAAPAVAVEAPAWLQQIKGESAVRDDNVKIYRTGRLASFNFDSATPVLRVLPKSAQIKPDFTVPKKSTTSGPAISATSTKQKTLRSIWSRLLKIDEDKIFLGDSFFNRGGDSITAMKLVSEARQQGMQLSVAQVFANRTLFDMANVMQPSPAVTAQKEVVKRNSKLDYQPFSLLLTSFMGRIQDRLENRAWKILDVLPARPLQEVAAKGTVELPRFSIRYELMHFEGLVDKKQLFRACQDLVDLNEVLRTVYVRLDGACYSVVIDKPFTVDIVEYEIDGDDVEAFAGQLSRFDAQTRMPYGSSFVKWFYVTNGTKSTLVFRLSHAQYDEICLPIFLNQLHQLYQDPESVSPSYPFSTFVNHVIQDAIPAAIPYWHNLLDGAKGISILRPDTPITDRRHFAIHKPVDISARSRDVTVATLPSAAWALTFARLLGVKDVVFGEVASGRAVDIPGIPDGNLIAGPCWQYVPTRVKFNGEQPIRTGHDLLEALQTQHMMTSSHDCMGLEEIVRNCTEWDPKEVTWFDTVVHQDVAHVETLSFLDRKAKFETIYAYEEPLREWKIQAFHDGDTLTLEVITFESWKEHAVKLLDDVCASLEQLVNRPHEELDIA